MMAEVQTDQLPYVWPKLEPLVERALSHGQGDSMEPCHVLHSLMKEDMKLWIAYEGEQLQSGMIFQVSQWPTKKVVFVVCLVGDRMNEWVDEMESALIKYQQAIGADCIEASCRKGLAKKLSARGWRQKAIIMEAPNGQ